MAKFEKSFVGDFDSVLQSITERIMGGSASASLEAESDFRAGDARCSVRVFERYSIAGGNRLSLSVTLFEAEGLLHLSAIAAGGSQGMFLKFNTFGEESFLNQIRELF